MSRGLAGAVDDGGVVLVDGDALCLAQILELDAFELDAEILSDGLATGENGDVAQDRLAAIAEAGSLDGCDVQGATQLVDHEGGESFALNVLRDDQQRLAATSNLLEQGKQILHRADLLFVDQDVGIVQGYFEALGVGDEVGAEVAAIKLHAVDCLETGVHGLRLFDGDDAVLADNLHGMGDDVADLLVAVGRDRADLGNGTFVNRLGKLAESAALSPLAVLVASADDGGHGLVDAALQCRRVGAGGNSLHAFAEDGLGQNGCGGGAVAGNVGGLGGDFRTSCAPTFSSGILQVDFLGHGHAVLGDGGRTKFLLNYDVAALGAERRLHGVCQRVHAAQDRLTGIFTVQNLLCHACNSPNSVICFSGQYLSAIAVESVSLADGC